MPLKWLPVVDKCCGCVNDLKTAAAIIAVLGIVTSPSVSWAVVRHSYVIHVSCFLTTTTSRVDIMDINLNNIVSFGFGANAGLSPSCLGPSNVTEKIKRVLSENETAHSGFVHFIKYLGWIVFLADTLFIFCSIRLLIRICKGSIKTAVFLFIYTAVASLCLSFFYGMLFVAACLTVGGAFPIFEFVFSIADVVVWCYFLIVVNSYRRKIQPPGPVP